MRNYVSFSLLALATVACQPEPIIHPDDCVVSEVYMHKYDIPLSSTDWKERGEEGKVVKTLGSGVRVTRQYVAGVLEGESTYSFPKSALLQKREFYLKGVKVRELENHSNGTPFREVKSTAVSETINFWYDNGTPMANEQYEAGRLISASYYSSTNQLEARVENGAGNRIERKQIPIEAREEILDGKPAERLAYYPDGSLKESIPYRNGIIEGTKKTYFEHGLPASVEEWVAGKQQGNTTLFEGGSKAAEISYIDGKKDGLEHRFHQEKGISEIQWKNDKQHGRMHTSEGDTWFYEGERMENRADFDRKGIDPFIYHTN